MFPKKLSRRDFLKKFLATLVGVTAIDFIGNPPSAEESIVLHPSKSDKKVEGSGKGSDNKLFSIDEFDHVDAYDDLIRKYTTKWNEEFEEIPGYEKLNPNIPKARIVVESGSKEHEDNVFKYDPMQIASDGDALSVLKAGSESGIPEEVQERFQGKKKGVRIDGEWNYNNTGMTPEDSVYGGIFWLNHKGLLHDKLGRIRGFEGWDKAVEQYNGSPKYLDKVSKTLEDGGLNPEYIFE
ncbi:MAG: hypothetical protein ABEK36_00255 [Candidatus Aenigmatarchaeota archaeon]